MTWNEDGVEVDADQRTAGFSVKALGIGTSSPWSTVEDRMGVVTCGHLESDDAMLCRAVAARANYLGQDSIYIQFTVNELSSHMTYSRMNDLEVSV